MADGIPANLRYIPKYGQAIGESSIYTADPVLGIAPSQFKSKAPAPGVDGGAGEAPRASGCG